jgi:hypothetical protein
MSEDFLLPEEPPTPGVKVPVTDLYIDVLQNKAVFKRSDEYDYFSLEYNITPSSAKRLGRLIHWFATSYDELNNHDYSSELSRGEGYGVQG